jgi:acyl phosphate:glycerol-3-phosphate acyltransferase
MLRAVILWVILGFFLGAVPFAYAVVKLALDKDVRDFGDGNPGGMNAWRAGGWKIGSLVIILDMLKGMLPVGLAHFGYGIGGWWIVPIALAPILGHAYSPFLDFKGGKSVSVSYGVWAGLTGWQMPLLFAVCQGVFFVFLMSDGWITFLGMAAGSIVLYVLSTPRPLVALAALNATIFAQRYRRTLVMGPKFRFRRPFKWIDQGL